ncbi:MAG TPA: cupin domain-containing protein [Puia sp.]|nr:cupin domain-containing protein [Puia sp.]HVW62164.1 cupin domain-containing protein [Puia sp.]
MEIIKCWEEEGELIKDPFKRHIKLFYGPDKRNIPELNFTQAIIYPGSGTDYHLHDRPELIYVVHGKGIAICEGEEYPIEEDCVFWVPTGMMHQVKNTGDETLKLATIFVPGYTRSEHIGRIRKAAEDAQK